MATDISDYPEALDRILSADVSPDSTSRGEVAKDLSQGGPQVTLEVAANVADSVLTEEQLTNALDNRGEIPEEDLIDAAARGLSDHSDADREDRVIDAVREQVATREDLTSAVEQDRSRLPSRDELREEIEEQLGEKRVVGVSQEEAIEETVSDYATLDDVGRAIRESRDSLPTESEIEGDVQRATAGKKLPGVSESDVIEGVQAQVTTREDVTAEIESTRGDGPVFREDVERAVETAPGDLPSGVDPDSTADQLSREIGAPSRQEVEQARVQAATPDDAITPAERDDLSSDSKTEINVIRDESGEAVGAFGGTEQGGVTPEQTAEEIGVEYLGSVSDVNDSIELAQSEGRAELQVDGKTVRRIDL